MARYIEWLNSVVFGPGLAAAILICGIFFTVRLIRPFVSSPKKLFGALGERTADGVSPAKAMCVALAGTLGVGNIAGVASAIYIGGAGAVFWMWVSALLAMPIKYAETTLAVRHRRRRGDEWHGGAFFYISDMGKRLSGFAAGFFAVLCLLVSFTMGSAVQSDAAAVSINELSGLPPVVCGIIIAVPLLAVILGGGKRIADISAKLIPAVCGLYIVMSVYIIILNRACLGQVFEKIFSEAFSPLAVGGGVSGVLTSRALSVGVTRGVVSNEAGCGTAPIAHSGANVREPAVQGFFGMAEVAVDTLVICTLTALTVLIGAENGLAVGEDGMKTAIADFGLFIPFADKLISISTIIFAFCTMICWYYYGSESLAYLKLGRLSRIYPFAFAAVCLLGAAFGGSMVWGLNDLLVSLMTVVNLSAVAACSGEIRKSTDDFFGINHKEKPPSASKPLDERQVL